MIDVPLVPPFLLLDRYEITAEIGRGGNAVVFRAHDRVLDRAVAVKVLRDDSLSSDTLVRFRQEVQVTARLEHAHILHVYDTGEYEGRPFIVMELASGRSLHERLEREGQLPIMDALQITRDVGLALAHAHARRVVHRDVKPENILLASGGAILGDFGIARVTTEDIARKITSTGTAVGTVLYMSPEQLCAEPNIDERSDQYSLACVLYEMLAGVRPHISASFAGLRMLRMTGQHSPVSAHRPRVSPAVNDAITTAMSPLVADRFRNMDEFLAALGVGASTEFQIADVSGVEPAGGSAGVMRSDSGGPAVTPSVGTVSSRFSALPVWQRWAIAAIVLTAIVAGGLMVAQRRDPQLSRALERADGTVEIVLRGPVASGDTASPSHRLHTALKAELGSWDALRLVERSSGSNGRTVTINPSVNAIADSVRIQVVMEPNVASGAVPISMMVAAKDLRAPTTISASLARRILLRHTDPTLSLADVPGLDALPGRSLSTLQAYVRGFSALRVGRLDTAAATFRAAARGGSPYPHAEYWAAQSGAWLAPKEAATWRPMADNAVRAGTLRGTDSLLAVALRHVLQAEFPEACAAYRVATAREPDSFTAWYGLGDCQRLDSLVVNRPEGLRFRSSHWSALDAYRRAVDLAPTSAWLSALFDPIMWTTYAAAGRSRVGYVRLKPRDLLAALPSLVVDTIGFIPLPVSEFNSMGQRSVPTTLIGALRRGRVVARDLTARWVKQFPESPDAWFQRAVALELDGQISVGVDVASADNALDRVEIGRPSPEMRARIAVARTRLALRRGDVKLAQQIARDATGRAVTSPLAVRVVLAPLAGFLGDVALAARLSAGDNDVAEALPTSLVDSLKSFGLYATLGICTGLAEQQKELDRLFNSSIAAAELNVQRAARLGSLYRLAVPCLGPGIRSEFTPSLPLDFAFVALAAGNRAEARRVLGDLRANRTGATFATISWDFLFAESWALVQAGDTANARAQLVGALDDIASMSLYTLDQMAQAAGLRRGLLLLRDISSAKDGASGSEKRWVERARELTATLAKE